MATCLESISCCLWSSFALVALLISLCFISHKFKYYFKISALFMVSVIASILMLPIALLRPRDPINLLRGTRIVYYLHWMWGVLWHLVNRENLKKKSYIIVANHQSSIDVLGMMVHWDAFHPVVPVMKREIIWQGLSIGIYCWMGRSIFIDRGSKTGRETLAAGIREAKANKTSMWIFPEGTRNRSSELLLPFKKGAFHMAVQAQLPILPVVYGRYCDSFYKRYAQRFDSGDAYMTILPEISTEGLTADDVGALTERVRNTMLEHLRKTSPTGSSKED